MANDLLKREAKLPKAGEDMLANSGIVPLLETLGTVTPRGSFTTGLMTYPDMDFNVQNKNPNSKDARKLIPKLFDEFHISEIKIADFSKNNNEKASYFLGFKFTYKNLDWEVAATVELPGPIHSNPPELDDWLANMTPEQRMSILELKNELKAAGRYAGARSTPPYTFRSVHLYEGVLKGNARTVKELEDYFKDRA